jgi:hypothetical protein
MATFLSKNMNNPNSDDTKKVAVVKFIVELNGAISDISSIINAFTDNACSDEAKRLIKKVVDIGNQRSKMVDLFAHIK